jgi:glycosyltransferase involved in cell wall biosynthesis
MMQLLELFKTYGYEISFGSTAAANVRTASLQTLGIPMYPLQLNDPSFNDLVRDLNPDVVLFDRFITEEQFGWRVAETCPDAVRILDTEDLHFLRKAREKAVKQGDTASAANLYSETAKRELASILRSDLSLIISEMEMELLRDTFHIQDGLLFYLPFIMDPDPKKAKNLPDFQSRKDFITIGNFQHAPNADAVAWLAKEIWPKIRQQLPQARLNVYGDYAPQYITELHNESIGFLIKGWASDVNEVMSNTRICLAPLRFGAGLKGKIADAMINGTPSVTTNIGAEGIHGDLPFGGRITGTVDEIVTAAVNLYAEEDEWWQAQDRGFRILRQRFDRNLFAGPFRMRIEELVTDVQAHRNKHFTGQILQHQSLQATKYLSKWIEQKNKR